MRPFSPSLRVILLLTCVSIAWGQDDSMLDGKDGRNLLLRNFHPKSTLQVNETSIRRAKFPVVDVHSHFEDWNGRADRVDRFVESMDGNNIAVNISLDGYVGDTLLDHQRLLWSKHKSRFLVFARIPWQGSGQEQDPATWDCHRPDFGHRVCIAVKGSQAARCQRLKDLQKSGARL